MNKLVKILFSQESFSFCNNFWVLVSSFCCPHVVVGLKRPRMISQWTVQTQMYFLVVDSLRFALILMPAHRVRRERRLNLFSYLCLFRSYSKPCFYSVSEESMMIFWIIVGSFDLFLILLFHVSSTSCGKRLFFILVVGFSGVLTSWVFVKRDYSRGTRKQPWGVLVIRMRGDEMWVFILTCGGLAQRGSMMMIKEIFLLFLIPSTNLSRYDSHLKV